MPVVSLTRPNQYVPTGYLNFVPSTVLFSRAVTSYVPSANSITSLGYNNAYSGTGAYTDIAVGQKIVLYSQNTAVVKGILRVAAGGASSTFIQVNEFSYGEVLPLPGDRFDVIAAFDPREMLVSADVNFKKDSRVSAGTYPSDPPPVCCSGGPGVGIIDSITSLLSITHYDASWRTDSDAGSYTQAWAFGAGATPTTSTSATPSVTYPEGFRWTTHTITDSNGTVTIQYVPIWANGSTYKPLPVAVTGRSASIDSGYHTIEFTVPRAYAAQVLLMADRSLICYWELESRDGTIASYGSNVTGRSHIKGVYYLDSRSISINADDDTLSFTAIGPAGVLAKLGALSQVMKTGTTSKWSYLKVVTVARALWYLLNWGSSIQLVHDFLLMDGDPYLYSELDITETSNILAQMNDLAKSIAVTFGSDQIGRLLLIRTLPYLTVAERAARTKTLDFSTALYVSIEWDESFRPSTKLVTIDGITTGATVAAQSPVYGWAPGAAPGEGTDVAALDKQIGTSAAQLYQRAGDEYRRLNGQYYDETTSAIRRVPMGVRLTVGPFADVVDPLLGEPVSITLPASTNTLGISFASTELWLVRSMDISYDADSGGKTVTYVLDHETHGYAGNARPNPNATSNTGISASNPGLTNPGIGNLLVPLPVGPTMPAGTTRMAAICDNGLALSVNFGSGGSTNWAYATWASLSVAGTVLLFVPDGFNVGSGWLVTSTKIYYLALSTGVATLKYTFGTASIYRNADASFSEPGGFFSCTSYYPGVGTKSLSTRNNFSTLIGGGEVTITAFWETSGAVNPLPGCTIDSRSGQNGKIYSSAFTATGAGGASSPDGSGYVSSDWGATWTAISPDLDPDIILAQQIFIPYGSVATVLFYNKSTTTLTTTGSKLYRLMGGVLTDVAPNDGTYSYSVISNSRNGLSSPVTNPNRMLGALQSATGAGGWKVYLTNNALAVAPTWTIIVDATVFRGCAISGDKPDSFYFWGVLGTVGISPDGGTTILDQTGNLASFTPGTVLAIGGY